MNPLVSRNLIAGAMMCLGGLVMQDIYEPVSNAVRRAIANRQLAAGKKKKKRLRLINTG